MAILFLNWRACFIKIFKILNAFSLFITLVINKNIINSKKKQQEKLQSLYLQLLSFADLL